MEYVYARCCAGFHVPWPSISKGDPRLVSMSHFASFRLWHQNTALAATHDLVFLQYHRDKEYINNETMLRCLCEGSLDVLFVGRRYVQNLQDLYVPPSILCIPNRCP